jgi:hypothetical protein
MLGVWLSREDHDKLEQFVGQFAVDENACVVPEKGARFMGTVESKASLM